MLYNSDSFAVVSFDVPVDAGDGALTRGEHRRGARKMFARMDANVDGSLTREELDQANRNTQLSGLYFKQLCDLRRRDPQDDLTTELVRAEEAGDKLSAEELEANMGLLFGAGHETTTNLIGNGLLALHRQRDQWERLKADPSLIPNAVEELLRFDSSVQLTGRVTHAEVEVGGVAVGPQESVIMLLGAANRDPAQYENPDRLDVGRRGLPFRILRPPAAVVARLLAARALRLAHRLELLGAAVAAVGGAGRLPFADTGAFGRAPRIA